MTRSTFLSSGSWRNACARPKSGSSGAAETTAVEKTEGLFEPMMWEESEARRLRAAVVKDEEGAEEEEEEEEEEAGGDMTKSKRKKRKKPKAGEPEIFLNYGVAKRARGRSHHRRNQAWRLLLAFTGKFEQESPQSKQSGLRPGGARCNNPAILGRQNCRRRGKLPNRLLARTR